MPTHGTDPTHAPTTVSDDELLDAVREWLPDRRWFPAKGSATELTTAGGLALTDPRGEAEVRLLLVRARSATVDSVLQVPLTLYGSVDGTGNGTEAAPPDGASGTEWVGTVSDGRLRVRDGAGDPPFLRAWLAAATGTDGAPADLGLDTEQPRVISGEQSNTSVILSSPDGGAILKVFRGLTPGENPDVDVPRRLAAAGWTHVPRPLGWLDGAWTTDDGEASGSLGVLSEFVAGASDGFELACDMASRHESFGRLAEDLGRVVAGMHVALAAAVPVDDDGSGGAELAAAVEERFRWAVGSVPELEEWSDAVTRRLARVRDRSDVPPRQRVHGDLHLGQVLRARDLWYVLDFEGEPLAGAEARVRPDLALRDVAGMLRSFDYAAAIGDAPAGWADEARQELLRGYRTQTGVEPDADVVDLLELDKTLYEAVYEARNRPQWRHIPAAALTRLLGGDAS